MAVFCVVICVILCAYDVLKESGVTVRAENFITEEYEIRSSHYEDRVAFVRIELEEPDAVIRFHFDNQIVSVVVEVGGFIDASQIPVPATRYGVIGTPGQAFMGWFTTSTPNFYINASERATTGFNVSQRITEALFDSMFVDGELNLYAAHLQYGDANGNGHINSVDIALMNNYLAFRITRNGMAPLVPDANADGFINSVDISLINNFLAFRPTILGPTPNNQP